MASNDYPRINVRINHAEEKNFKILKDHGYSAREVLELALNTKGSENVITVISKINGEPIQFPKNILSLRRI